MLIKVLVGALLLAGIGGGAWFFTKEKTPSQEGMMKDAQEATAASGTFSELMAREGSWKCDAKATHEYGMSEGTVYMNAGELRGDFVATMNGQTVNTSFVSKDGYMYTWSDLLPQGFKVETAAAGGTSGGEGIDPATPVEYSCEVWIADPALLAIPSDIEFYEVGATGGAGMNIPLPR